MKQEATSHEPSPSKSGTVWAYEFLRFLPISSVKSRQTIETDEWHFAREYDPALLAVDYNGRYGNAVTRRIRVSAQACMVKFRASGVLGCGRVERNAGLALRPRRFPHVENRTCYRVGGAAARHGFDDRICHARSAAFKKRDQWPQQRPRPGEMATMLARPLGKSSLPLVLARSLGTGSLRVSATLKSSPDG